VKAFVSWSGGKETSLACYRAMQNRDIKITHFLNMASENGDYSRSHRVKSELLNLQADAIGVCLIQGKTTWQTYEDEFKTKVSGLKKAGIQAGVFGDIDVQEHRDWVERVCKEKGIKPILPLWKGEREKLINDFIGLGFKAVIVATNAESLGQEWLGRKIDKKLIKEFKALGSIDLCGENGEYHTFVYDGPIFKKPVEFIAGEKILKSKHWFLNLKSKQ